MSVTIKNPRRESDRTRAEQTNLHKSGNVQRWTIPARDAVDVSTSDSGVVVIRQPIYNGDDGVVVVHTDDIPRLIRMLRLAQAALKGAGHG